MMYMDNKLRRIRDLLSRLLGGETGPVLLEDQRIEFLSSVEKGKIVKITGVKTEEVKNDCMKFRQRKVNVKHKDMFLM